MRTWVTSDLHFEDERNAERRGFSSAEEHDAEIIRRWNAAVKPKDTVHVLGDLNMRNLTVALEKVRALNGTKHLIAGNHDACHPMKRNWRTSLRRYLEVFETVSPVGSIRHNKQTILLSHFPYYDDHTAEPRHREWRLPDVGLWLLHGHTHKKDQRLHGAREIHVGVDAWNLTPVDMGTIIKMMAPTSPLAARQ